MVRYLELVLALPQAAAQTWLARREPAHGAHSETELDAALISALAALPQVTAAGVRANSSEAASHETAVLCTPCRDPIGALAADGLLMSIDDGSRGRRVTLVKRVSYSPALNVCEPIFEVPLETGAPLNAVFESAPQVVKGPLAKTLAKAGDLAPDHKQAYARECWQWRADDGITIDLAFEHGAVALHAEDAQLPRELRLTTPYADDAPQAAIAALFTVAYDLSGMLPAFPVLRSARDNVTEDASAPDAQPQQQPVRATSIDLSGLSTPQAALIAISNNVTEHWFGNDAGVRDSINTEFVHQLRVAQRRLKTALRIFPHWNDDAWETRVKPELKWLSSVLGEARDWDVFVDTTLPALAAADGDRERWAPTRERANQRRLEVRTRIQAAVASTRYAHVALAWLEWVSALPAREPPAKDKDLSLHAYANKRVRKYYERLVGAPKLTTLTDEARHKERIQAKYLRYTLEFFDSLASQKTRNEFAKTVSRLQSVLGDSNDMAVALGYLDALDVEPYQAGFARGWGEAARHYTAQEGEHLLRSLGKPKLSRDSEE
jgi:CHAD domain-containing protein